MSVRLSEALRLEDVVSWVDHIQAIHSQRPILESTIARAARRKPPTDKKIRR